MPENAGNLVAEIESLVEQTASDYRNLRFGAATRNILAISEIANNYVQQNAPWATIKVEPEKARDDLTFVVNCIKIIAVLLKPVLPSYCEKIEQVLGLKNLTWQDAKFDLEKRDVQLFEKLLDRLEPGAIEHLVEASRDTLMVKNQVATNIPDFKEEITMEDFGKIDLRVGKVLSAESVEGADKLLKLTVDLGKETRTVFAGIKASYEPSSIIGRTVVVLANLKPRKMRFGTSEAMLLAAAAEDGKAILCELDTGLPGTPIK
jgi:methionyl-tRNA synthetase